MWGLLEYLQQPSLVAEIQYLFGVKEKSRSRTQNITSNNCEIPGTKNITHGKKKTVGSNGVGTSDIRKEEDYIIENKWWYYLFIIGTGLGDEIFYAAFIPFWFWNIDGAVGRRVVLVWTIVMCVGQGIKDVLKWPRPTYPAVRLQRKWAEEYGMPSTHAMVGVSIPFSIILYTMDRYIYSVTLGVVLAFAWCALICVSRVYLGMHSVLDIVAGLALALLLMIPMVPLVDHLDHIWLTSAWSPVVLTLLAVLVIVWFPHSEHWTPTRGDTTMIISVSAGIHIGSWLNYQLGNMVPFPQAPPYTIIWPDPYMLGLGGLRTVLGFSLVLVTRNASKFFGTKLLCHLFNLDATQLHDKNQENKTARTFVELATKYFTYFAIGFNIVYLLPALFRFLSIERPTFYTEI